MGEWGNLQEIRDEMQQILDRIDTKLIERQEQQTPQQRERVFGRLVRGSVIVAAFVAAWRWIRGNRAGQLTAVAAVGAVTALLIVGPPDAPPSPPVPDVHHPWPWDVRPSVETSTALHASVSATIKPEPELPDQDSSPDQESPAVRTDQATAEPEPIAPSTELRAPDFAESTLEPSPEPQPDPEPQPEPTEPPDDEDEDTAREICLGLDARPVIDLGVCIRQLLGLL